MSRDFVEEGSEAPFCDVCDIMNQRASAAHLHRFSSKRGNKTNALGNSEYTKRGNNLLVFLFLKQSEIVILSVCYSSTVCVKAQKI